VDAHADADADSSLMDVAVIDADVDGQACIPTPGVDATPGVVTQLPSPGVNPMMRIHSNSRYVVYSELRNNNGDPFNFEIFLYDVALDQELQLTDDDIGVQWDPYIWADEIMWSNGYDYQVITKYTISSGEATTLPVLGGVYNSYPELNDDHVLYASKEGVPANDGHFSLYLLDRISQEKILIASYETSPETYSLGERFPAWVAYDPEAPPGSTKDVYYYDVDAGAVVHLESTGFGWQYFPIHGGDYIYWEDDRDGDWNIYRYRLSTGEEERFTWDESDQGYPRIQNHLLTWMDLRWSCGQYWGGNSPRDLVIYDTENETMRRVTKASDLWTNVSAGSSWYVYSRKVGDRLYRIYAHDLVADGVLDGPDGHVIAGDPLEP
jgi:hypothetical protein